MILATGNRNFTTIGISVRIWHSSQSRAPNINHQRATRKQLQQSSKIFFHLEDCKFSYIRKHCTAKAQSFTAHQQAAPCGQRGCPAPSCRLARALARRHRLFRLGSTSRWSLDRSRRRGRSHARPPCPWRFHRDRVKPRYGSDARAVPAQSAASCWWRLRSRSGPRRGLRRDRPGPRMTVREPPSRPVDSSRPRGAPLLRLTPWRSKKRDGQFQLTTASRCCKVARTSRR